MVPLNSPFLVVNPKAYLYGQDSLDLAKAADKIASEANISIFFTSMASDLRLIADNTENLFVTAQHMDPIQPGRGMGKLHAEALKAAGARAVFLNHAENPLRLDELAKTIEYARKLEIISIVCADSVIEGRAIAMLKPDILLCEPTDLIGTGTVADDSYILETISAIREVDDDILIMIASGITTADDVYNVIYLGADGTGATSGIIKAPNPPLRIKEMAKAVITANKDRKTGK